MAIFSQRRLIFSLRQPFHSSLNLNFSISRSSSPTLLPRNPNFRPSQVSSTSVLHKFLTSFNSSTLTRNWSFRSSFNGVRSFGTRSSESWSSINRPPKETIMLEGCDMEHWLVVMDPPDPQLTRDDIIDGYIKTLAQILESEEEARMKLYSVSTRHYFAFGALISEELSNKLKELPNVRWVLPDSYMDVKNKTYAGEPVIDGQPVPYDPKYHEVWVWNHEQSLRHTNKNRRRQKDPNSRQRSPAFASAPAHGSSNQNWISSPVPQNQAPETSNPQNSQPPSLSDSGGQRQNWMPPANSPNKVAQSSEMHNPSHMQSQARNQAPQPSHMQNHPMPRNPPPAPPPSSPPLPNPNSQGWGTQSGPPLGYENEAQHLSQMHNQRPPPSAPNPYAPARNFQSQNWETAPRYQSQPEQPPMSNNQFSYDTMPPTPSSNVPYIGQSRGPPSGYQNQSPQPPISNSFSYDNVPPRSPAWGMPPHMQNTNFHEGSVPSQVQQNGYSYRDIPHHNQIGGFSNGYPSQPLQQQQYQENYSTYNDMHSSKSGVIPQSAQNYQNSNVVPSAPARDMSSHTWNQNSSRWDVSAEVQHNSYPRNLPLDVQNSRPHVVHPPHISQYQQYQNSSTDLQNTNATASSQDWNYQSTTPYMQNSFSSNMPMSHGVQNHQFQGNDTPRPTQNSEFQNNLGSDAQNVSFNSGGKMPNDRSREIVQTRDYQERDVPTDDYMYASK